MKTVLVASLGLSVAAGALRAQGTERPTADQVVERALTAAGGRAALGKRKSLHIVAAFEIPAQGITGTLETWRRRPSLFRSKLVIPMLGTIESGYDGKVGWSLNPSTGARVLDGADLASAEQDALWSDDPTATRSRTFVGDTTFDGRACWVLKVVVKSGEERTNYYDKETGLAAGSEFTRTTAAGAVPVTVVVSDYRDVGGIRLAFRNVQHLAGAEQVITVQQAEFDANAEAAVFELPKEIKALVAK